MNASAPALAQAAAPAAGAGVAVSNAESAYARLCFLLLQYLHRVERETLRQNKPLDAQTIVAQKEAFGLSNVVIAMDSLSYALGVPSERAQTHVVPAFIEQVNAMQQFAPELWSDEHDAHRKAVGEQLRTFTISADAGAGAPQT